MSRRGSRVDEPAAYHAEGILYLAPNARYDFLLNLPEAQNIGAKVNDAMRDAAKCELRSPKSEVQSVRHSEFVIRHSPVLATVDYDAFGRIYERTDVEVRSASSDSSPVRHSEFVIRHSRRPWIQLFHSALNAKGRAGFVMANSASDARASEQECGVSNTNKL